MFFGGGGVPYMCTHIYIYGGGGSDYLRTEMIILRKMHVLLS